MKAALSIAFENLRGKAGSLVITKTRSGLVVKPRTMPRDPRTPGQALIRGYMSKTAATYRNLTTAQIAAWQAYAATQVKVNPVSGDTYSPTAINAFMSLALKFLQASPSGTIPVNPPSSAFTGDTAVITAAATTGGIIFTSSKSNPLTVTTELLLQPLKSKNRTPAPDAYRTKAFNGWQGGLTQTVNVTPGYYAAAYRFVSLTTGQATPLQIIGITQVTLALEEERAA